MAKPDIYYPKSETITERGGVVNLRKFSTPNFTVMVSPSGRELIRQYPSLLLTLHAYRREFEIPYEDDKNVRRHYTHGQEGIIYDVAQGKSSPPVVIKEYKLPFRQTDSLLPIERQAAFLRDTLVRAEYLRTYCEEYMPDYIRVPDHYGFLFLPDDSTGNINAAALIMQKVNGMTLEQVLTQGIYQRDEQTFMLTNGLREMLISDYQENIYLKLHSSSEETDPRFTSQILAPDLFEKNILVDFSSFTDESPYTLWITDQ